MSPCLENMDKSSPQYTQALEIIRTGAARLKNETRADMYDFQMRDSDDLQRLEKYNQCKLRLDSAR